MEVKKITNEIREQLRKPLPKEAVSQHPTKIYLSAIKAIYVVERLNDVFGIGQWYQKSEIVKEDTKMIVVKSFLTIPEYAVELEAYGGNDNSDLGDAYKGAVTDALTKMGSYLEIGIDVFKGLTDKPKGESKTDEVPIIEWLSKEQFEKAMASDIKGISATLNTFSNSGGKGMNKEFRSKLFEQLKKLKSNG